MQNYSLYLLWLPKYSDEYYNVDNEQEETPFLKEEARLSLMSLDFTILSLRILKKNTPLNR